METAIDTLEERQITFLSPINLLTKALQVKNLRITSGSWSHATSLPSEILGRWEVDEEVTRAIRQQKVGQEIRGERVELAIIAQMDGSRGGVKLLSSATGTNVPCELLFRACAYLHPELPDAVHEVARTSDGALFLPWDELGYPGLQTVDHLFLDLVREIQGNLAFLKILSRSELNPFDPAPFRLSTASHKAVTLWVPCEDQHLLFARWIAQGREIIKQFGNF